MQETAKNSDTITQQSVKKLLPFFGLFPLISAFKNYQAELDEESGRPLSSVSSATVRKWLSRVNKNVKAEGRQEDSIVLFEELHKQTGKYLPLMEETNEKKAIDAKQSHISLPLKPNERNSFKKQFDFAFDYQETGIHIKKWFSKAPKGFLVEIPKAAEKQRKIETVRDIPMKLELKKEQCREGSRNYTPDVFILHHGSTSSSGHYTSYVKRNGYWWHVDDGSVTQVSDRNATSALKNAYIVHYAQA